jgi:hypothetical protein
MKKYHPLLIVLVVVFFVCNLITPGGSAQSAAEPPLHEQSADPQRVRSVDDELLNKVESLIDSMNYTEAARALQDLDQSMGYNRRAYLLRGGLLGSFRKYEEAIPVYKRLLEDQSLDQTTRDELKSLLDYCVAKLTADPQIQANGTHRCHFCKAVLSPKSAYCPVCLAFQPQIALWKAGKATTTFNYDENELRSVNYRFYESHDGGNAFRSIMGGLAAGTGTTASVAILDPEEITRDFSFNYDNAIPQTVEFSSEAHIGGQTTMTAQSIGGVAVTNKQARESATSEAFEMNDLLVYANSPAVDATFLRMAFKQNVYRGFASSWNFSPYWWEEPHVFVLYYDKDMRVVKAVDSYLYGKPTNAGHRVVTGRKPFTGPQRTDPLNDVDIFTFDYNEEGLLSTIRNVYKGQEFYRRDITYGPQGIVKELEFFQNNKKPKVTKYEWRGNHLVTAKSGGDGYTTIKIGFK